MRCLCLADELAKHGWQPLFICEAQQNIATTYCTKYPIIPIEHLSSSAGQQQVIACLRGQTQLKAVVVDHYQLHQEWCLSVKQALDTIMVVIDDLDRSFADIDLLVAFNKTAVNQGHSYRVLAGPEYSLIRDEFLAADEPIAPVKFDALINFGGSDPDLFTLQALNQLSDLPKPLQLLVIVGSAFPALEQLKQLITQSRHQIEMIVNCQQMAKAMQQAKVLVFAPGISAFEGAALGRPLLLLQTDPCQTRNYQLFQQHQAACCSTLERLAVDLNQQLQQDNSAQIQAAKQLCDGLGKIKIRQQLEQLVGNTK